MFCTKSQGYYMNERKDERCVGIHSSAHKYERYQNLFPSRELQAPEYREREYQYEDVRSYIHGAIDKAGFRVIYTVAGGVRIPILRAW